MIDLSKYKCPHCGYKRDNYAIGNRAICGTCGIAVEGPDPDDERYTGAAIFIRLSEAVHGKPHDGPTVEVRIAVGVGPSGGANCSMDMQRLKEDMPRGSAFSWVAAVLPVPVAQEVKGRVEE